MADVSPIYPMPARTAQPRVVALRIVTNPVQHRLERLSPWLRGNRVALDDLLRRQRHVPARSSIAADGATTSVRGIHDGWACVGKFFASGRRQITQLLVPGDIHVQSRLLSAITGSVAVALTPVTTIDASALAGAFGGRGAEVLQHSADMAHALLSNQAARLGGQSAFERTAHLFLELRDRLRLAGLCNGDSFAMPLTQEVLGEVLGLTGVHMNRILQQLRGERLIRFHGGLLEILEPQTLADIADYEAAAIFAGN